MKKLIVLLLLASCDCDDVPTEADSGAVDAGVCGGPDEACCPVAPECTHNYHCLPLNDGGYVCR